MSISLKTKVSIFVLSLLLQTSTAIALILAGVMNAYPDAKVTTIQLVYTIISLFSIPFTLITGKLASVFTKKTLALVALSMQLLGGVIGYSFSYSLTFVFVASILVGISSGMIYPLSAALVAESFDGAERARVIGLQALFTNAGAIFINMAGGYLAASYWPSTYLIFFAAIPVMILFAVLYPKKEIEKEIAGEKVKAMNAYLLMLLFQAFLFGLSWMTVFTNISIYVYDLGMGTAAQAGWLTMMQAFGSVLIGLVLPQVMKITSKYCFVVAALFSAAGMLMFAFAATLPMFMFAAVLVGVGFGLFMPAGYTLIPDIVHPTAITLGIASFAASFSIGAFLNPYLITLGAGLINSNIATRFLLAGFILILNSIVGLIAVKKSASNSASLLNKQ